MNKIGHFFITHPYQLNLITIITIIPILILAVMSFNSSFLDKKSRSEFGFLLLGLAVCDLATCFKILAVSITVLAVGIVIVVSLFYLGYKHYKHIKEFDNRIMRTHEIINSTPKIQRYLHTIMEKAHRTAHFEKYGTYTMNLKDSKKLHEMVKQEIKRRNAKKHE